MSGLKVMFDRVLVKLVESAKQTQSGITLPDSKEYKIKKGIVAGIGQTVHFDSCINKDTDNTALFSIGDKVIFEDFCAIKLEIDGEKYAILKCIDILAKEID